MTDEEAYRREARNVLSGIDVAGIYSDASKLSDLITQEFWRFRKPYNKFLFLDEAIHFIQAAFDKHLLICTIGPTCLVNQGMEKALSLLKQEIDILPKSGIEPALATSLPKEQESSTYSLAHFHPTVLQSASSLFATNHYSQAILAACTALDKAIQAKAQIPASTVGTALMTKSFSANQPLIRLSQDTNEQMGFMNLYQGSVQAIRNHYAHNLTEIPAARALEWLGFISALFYKLDEALPATVSPAS